jgi:hypothetical protein
LRVLLFLRVEPLREELFLREVELLRRGITATPFLPPGFEVTLDA